jgi:hypothetical protein
MAGIYIRQLPDGRFTFNRSRVALSETELRNELAKVISDPIVLEGTIRFVSSPYRRLQSTQL